MERIAPLAKILAEANGIEWQQLNGTGAGGMIVEQDILDYLSRVMSGEAEPPSTPVDAPPPDWNGEDLPGGGMFDAQMLSQAGVESDIADFVQKSRPGGATLSQDDFELDDAQDDQLLAPPAAPRSPSPFDIPPVAPATPSFSSGPVPTDPIPVSTGPINRIPESPAALGAVPESQVVPAPAAPTVPAAPVPPAPVPPAPVPAATAPTAKAPAAGGLGNLLSRLYQKDGDRPAAPAPVTPEPRPSSFGTPGNTLGTGTLGSASLGAGSAAGSTDTTRSGAGSFGSDPVTSPTSPFNVPPVELRDAAPLSDKQAPALPDLTAPQTAPMTAQVDADEVTPEQAAPLAASQDRVQDSFAAVPDRAAPDMAHTDLDRTDVAENEATVADMETEADVDMVTDAKADVETVEPVAAPVPAPVAPAASAPAAPRDAVWFGTYLRRDAQVAQLHDLRQQLSEALEREVPLGLLVARAAQRHAAALGLESIALRDMDRGLTRQMGGEVGGSVSLRDALKVTDQDFGGTPDLLVVDAGALDMDDLHYPDTLTLSVGRVQDGRAALSLQGDVDPEKAARFLASVAQTLEKPIILLV
ncbi:E3 binding domain-containing protein [Deinococcus wulumuqiensis]|uniref:Peripheral subunit-binding (PSBD) domain-containing protein n=1 Tax=Deinococcus wulumuqiensis TaxID=980427 RepID=A0AAV4K6G0_9DEIO|nr:E3 binding domain-containing protein [Deinococcus wulumuqiensis]QII21158.1 hypothetical protein G6R31_10700 [Deinococcus wulumuqiensis R12]GGI83563.1 hypothetical protein GCM10010914_17370 [Deinococcus wulumuqiensis]GGP29628.1 hypothetical protein GCM10008021_12790 [Deinococcus wulumuqiensis]